MDKHGEEAHLSGASIVELHGSNPLLLLRGVVSFCERDSEIARGGSLYLLPPLELPPSDGKNDLPETEGRNRGQASLSVGKVGEVMSFKVESARESV